MGKMNLYQYIVLAVFAVPFVWHLARGRFKVAFFVLGVFTFFMMLIVVLTVVLLRIEGGAL